MRPLSLFFLCLACFLVAPAAAPAATADEEQRLIDVLQSSSASPEDRDAACARLKRIGTGRSVPALAALLADEQLSHSARYALEPMPSGKAGRALTDALAKTYGLTRVGIVISLGCRGEKRAVLPLVKLLKDPDPQVAAAAARALGQIGGAKARKALQTAVASPAGPVHDAVVDACLRCANRLLAEGSESKALTVFRGLYDTQEKDTIRTAAYRGMILASGKKALPLMTGAILGNDSANQTAALEMVRRVSAPGATKTLTSLSGHVGAPLQAALIEGLSQRGDLAAASAIVPLVTSPSPQVRLAAINALGNLGDAFMAPLLAVAAASSTGEEQKAARLALVQLHRGNPTETLLRLLPEAKPEVQAEFARALGGRSDKTAVPPLMELARQGSGSTAKAALRALGSLVEDPQLGMMVQLVVDAKTESARASAAEALNTACHETLTRRGRVGLEPLLQALATGTPETRIALLPICSGLVDPKVRAALRTAVAESDPQVREVGIRALCDTVDPELAPDVLKLACEEQDAALRTLAVRACVRLTTQEEAIKPPVKKQVETLKAILATTLTPDQKRVVLAGLAEVPDAEALGLAEPMLDEAAVQLEAAQAITKIANALPYLQAEAATNALAKVLATITDPVARKAPAAALKVIRAGTDYIMAWQAAGPYLQEGKEYKDLFDIPFPPETATAASVEWKAMPPGPEAKRPWVMDLLKMFGGDQRVAYARTWVYSEQRQPASLELGTDDGVKVWLNHEVVHTNNIFRGLQPATDKVQVTLHEGWNPLLLKVTQLNQGWAFCARLRQTDGSHMDGLQFSPEPPQSPGTGEQP